MNLHELNVHETTDALEKGECSSVQVTQAYLDRIDAVDARVGAFLHINREQALADAKAADVKPPKGAAVGKQVQRQAAEDA